jgi:hypothetical protein
VLEGTEVTVHLKAFHTYVEVVIEGFSVCIPGWRRRSIFKDGADAVRDPAAYACEKCCVRTWKRRELVELCEPDKAGRFEIRLIEHRKT